MTSAEQRQYLIAGMVWSLWANYWTDHEQLIPPLHYLRMGAGEDFIFVSGVSETQLDGFLLAVKSVPELGFSRQGSWWLHPSHWFGHWTNFSATIRPALDGVQRWRAAGISDNAHLLSADVVNTTPESDSEEPLENVRSEASTEKRGWERWWSRNEGKPK